MLRRSRLSDDLCQSFVTRETLSGRDSWHFVKSIAGNTCDLLGEMPEKFKVSGDGRSIYVLGNRIVCFSLRVTQIGI